MVSYDIEAVNYGTPEELEQDRKAIKRLLARFYRVSTERTIRWVLDVQNTERSAYILKRSAFIPQDLDEPILDLTCPPLVDFCAHIERSSSPDQIPPPATPADGQLAQADDFDYSCDVEEAEIMEPILLATPPPFDITSVSVIYFDVYDTLIDRESGIFSALRPLLKQSRYAFNRKEALSFYFESEAEMKEQKPGAPYAQILANTYRDVALRLGIAPVHATDASIFAQSAANWPCITDAGWLLHNLVHNSQISLAAIADVDREFLLRTSAFTSLAPFFEAVFTWDACHAYKPATVVFDAPLLYYDSLGVPRAHSFLVSGSLLRDMEPARQVGLPAVWIRSPGSLAANLDAVEDASPVGTFCTLSDLGNCFLGAYRAPMTWEDPPASRMRTGGPLLLPSNAPTSASISPALHHIIRRM
ncbi:HAD-like domain-containing protein [Mycena polygramma]|nr:HAD-like domain-containing protein [Mycena polygramma]